MGMAAAISLTGLSPLAEQAQDLAPVWITERLERVTAAARVAHFRGPPVRRSVGNESSYRNTKVTDFATGRGRLGAHAGRREVHHGPFGRKISFFIPNGPSVHAQG